MSDRSRKIFDALRTGAWTEVMRLVGAQEEESLHLDFKMANSIATRLHDDDEKSLSKGASGFANVEGGVILFGVTTQRSKQAKRDLATGVRAVGDVMEVAEQFRRALTRVVEPAVAGVEVLPITDPTTANAGVIAVHIPQSEGAPHRANAGDPLGRYYMRTANSTEIMPHRLLMAMATRRPTPRLVVRPSHQGSDDVVDAELSMSRPGMPSGRLGWKLRLRIDNEGTVAAHNLRVTVSVGDGLQIVRSDYGEPDPSSYAIRRAAVVWTAERDIALLRPGEGLMWGTGQIEPTSLTHQIGPFIREMRLTIIGENLAEPIDRTVPIRFTIDTCR